jgi:long-chain acyl-CoA synthetase
MYKAGQAWKSIPAQEMLRRIAVLSRALAELGVVEGDRVALFAPNCPEWHVADFAVTGLGAVVVPIYFRESPERIGYILRHCEARIVFLAGREQVMHLLAMRERLASVERIIISGAEGVMVGSEASEMGRETLGRLEIPKGFLRFEEIIAQERESDLAAYRRRVASLVSNRLASIIYTSGTTGEPKGVMLSHANFVSNEIGSFENFSYGPDDIALSFLPLAHVYERLIDYGYLFRGIPLAYVPRPEEVTGALAEVRPTIAAAVPRFFEKLYAAILERGTQTTGVRRRVFDWSMGVARRAAPWRAYGRRAALTVMLEWWMADGLVYRKFRAGIGGRMRMFISGGAPLARELAEFLTTVGVPIFEGYGLTETSPVVANNIVAPNRIGTVGRPIRGVEVRIADDGEILVRGPCVMMGYYKNPEDSRAVISPEGWFATGDVGYLDPDGYLVITDRKKDLIKTAGGKMIAPAPIENVLKTSPYIQNVALVGDKRRFVAALIVPNFANVEARARDAGLSFLSHAELAAHPWVHTLIHDEIARLTSHLAQFEAIKRFALLDHDFTFDGGQLTYTLKVKRRVIEQRYAEIIERLYAGSPPPRS